MGSQFNFSRRGVETQMAETQNNDLKYRHLVFVYAESSAKIISGRNAARQIHHDGNYSGLVRLGGVGGWGGGGGHLGKRSGSMA